ncbi:MAG: hypothetical protein HYV25_01500 [Candidatus Harrisonbacteria bacterium]|nr:hypothetical protein [Candidatus Harrisonbacteria bacterium]
MPALHWVILGSALGGMLFLALGLCFAWHWKKGAMVTALCAAIAAFAVCVRAGEMSGRTYALGCPLAKSDVKLGVIYDVVGGTSATCTLQSRYVSNGYLPCRSFTVTENEHRLREFRVAPGETK